jgi:predicted outer membrane repeat protein
VELHTAAQEINMNRRIRTHRLPIHFTLALVLSAGGIASGQTTYYVSPCGDDAWSGASSACAAPNGPKRTIQAAINAAASNDTIIVADGTYSGAGNHSIDFGGRLITLRSENGAAGAIIDIGGSAAQPRRAFHFHSGETAQSIVEGFTIQNGYMSRGGAVLCEASSPLFRACTFRQNTAWTIAGTDGGGAVYNLGSSPTFIDCEFIQNHAESNALWAGGGAMRNQAGSNPVLNDCRFTQNSATGPGTATSGGVANNDHSHPQLFNCIFIDNESSHWDGAMAAWEDSGVTAVDCEFRQNRATSAGAGAFSQSLGGSASFTNCLFHQNNASSVAGAILNENSELTLTDCTFTANSARFAGALYGTAGAATTTTVVSCTFEGNFTNSTGGDNAGGAFVANAGSTALLTNCRFIDNTAATVGGAVGFNDARVTLTNCTFLGNTSTGTGGAVFANNFTQIEIMNGLFAGNHGFAGGAVRVQFSSHADIVNSTFAQNTASTGGGAVHLVSSGSLNMANAILWSNVPDQVGLSGTQGAVTVGFSNIQGGWPGAGNINADPLFANIAAVNLSLSDGSPCIDQGDNAAVPAGIAIDLAGDPRFASDGLAPGCGRVDMGAYEFQGGVCYANCDCSTTAPVLNIADFSCFLGRFAAGDPYANCDGSTTPPILNVADFGCFLASFAAGCP